MFLRTSDLIDKAYRVTKEIFFLGNGSVAIIKGTSRIV